LLKYNNNNDFKLQCEFNECFPNGNIIIDIHIRACFHWLEIMMYYCFWLYVEQYYACYYLYDIYIFNRVHILCYIITFITIPTCRKIDDVYLTSDSNTKSDSQRFSKIFHILYFIFNVIFLYILEYNIMCVCINSTLLAAAILSKNAFIHFCCSAKPPLCISNASGKKKPNNKS